MSCGYLGTKCENPKCDSRWHNYEKRGSSPHADTHPPRRGMTVDSGGQWTSTVGGSGQYSAGTGALTWPGFPGRTHPRRGLTVDSGGQWTSTVGGSGLYSAGTGALTWPGFPGRTHPRGRGLTVGGSGQRWNDRDPRSHLARVPRSEAKDSPTNAPLAAGSVKGLLSPARWGRNMTPPAPAGVAAAAASKACRVQTGTLRPSLGWIIMK
eukprot:1195013-Prorocentrum_minimum.AAC.9